MKSIVLKSAALVYLLIWVASTVGCLGQNETPKPAAYYVCQSLEVVSDPSLCPSPTAAAPQSTMPPASPPSTVALTTTTSSTTTVPETTTTSTLLETTSTTFITTSTTTTTSTSTTTTTEKPKPIIEIVETRLIDEPNGWFWIGGKLRNNGATEVLNVQVKLTYYNKLGKAYPVVNTPPIESIRPGAVTEFNAIKTDTLKDNIGRYVLTVVYEE